MSASVTSQIKAYASILLFHAPIASILAANADAGFLFSAMIVTALIAQGAGMLAYSLWKWIDVPAAIRIPVYEFVPAYAFSVITIIGIYALNVGAIGFFTSYFLIALSLAIPALIKMISKSRSAIAEAREVSEAQQPPQQQITGPRRDAD